MKSRSKEVSLKLEFFEGKQDEEKGIFEGGVKDPECLDEIGIDVIEGETFDLEKDEFVSNGKFEVHLKGSDRAFRELGKYLIAMTYYETKDPNYHDHFDNLTTSSGDNHIDLIVYKPEK
ncbi:Imm32 family immunity protein [Aquisalibacillus elongatus]|uniref:Uncharacterized protein n=1 Tax=Aquisalibacillus elongatus TaxID=485577 RepID=A0A3N5C760_9BACI|nr:hypothetical protein [Aquisalibacillus elongatus]RPF54155.1 hypothetical protein EDC24_1346 [Aquisalibacillus elongatus]